MKKYYFLIIVALILGLALTGCSLLSNISQVPATDQSGITYLTKSVPPPEHLVGLWHFDEGSGQQASDSSDNNNHGRLGYTTGIDINDPTWVSGKFGTALSFDGNDFVLVPDDSSIAPSSVTVEAWVKQLGTPGTFKYIISKYYVFKAGGWSSYAFYTGSTGGLYFYIGDATKYRVSPDAGIGIWDGEWHHIAGTFDDASDTLKLYVDGLLVPGSPWGTGATAIGYDTGDLYFGTYRFPNGGWCFSGTIDEVRIWDIALPQDQLGKVYEFDGFFRPVENIPTLNLAKAGSAIPVKFSLDGDYGLDIFALGYPKSISINCDGTDPNGDIEETVIAGDSSLNYDADANQYIYVWKTNKTWVGCRQLEVKLKDGKSYYANFKFK